MERDISTWAVSGFFLSVALVGLVPVVDVGLTIFPLQPTDLIWRYGAVGLAAGYLPTPIFALALFIGLATWRGHPILLRLAGAIAVVTGVMVLAVMAVFAVDLMGVRALRGEDQSVAILVSGIVQEVKYFGGFLALACLGLGALRTATRVHARQMGAVARSPSALRTRG